MKLDQNFTQKWERPESCVFLRCTLDYIVKHNKSIFLCDGVHFGFPSMKERFAYRLYLSHTGDARPLNMPSEKIKKMRKTII